MKDVNELLAELRLKVEPILVEGRNCLFGDKLPDCPSQGLRAIRLLECLEHGSTKDWPIKMRHKWYLNAATLKDFLAVRRTVTLMERSEREAQVQS